MEKSKRIKGITKRNVLKPEIANTKLIIIGSDDKERRPNRFNTKVIPFLLEISDIELFSEIANSS